MRMVAADEATVAAGTTYLFWFMPALALQFASRAMGSALSGTGIVRPGMIVQTLAVMINIALAPVLITGWGTGLALGVAGAGLASSIAVLMAVLMMWIYFRRLERYVGFDFAQIRPQLRQWKRILDVGLPAGGDFAIVFLWMGVIYYVLRDFGPAAQAGFGIGTRVLGLIQMPVLSIAIAAGPVTGQNFGAGDAARVREVFTRAAAISTLVMIVFTILAHYRAELLLRGFASDAETIAVAVGFLQLVSLNLVAQGLNFVCGSIFQGLGNTRPVLISSAARLITYSLPVLWLSARPGFRIEYAWYVSNFSTTLQAALSLWLLHLEFRKRLASLESSVLAE
jgi:putative MATE family efflux protein